MSLAIDSAVLIDTPDYTVDGFAVAPPTPDDAGGAAFTPPKRHKRPEWRIRAIARCVSSSLLTAHGTTTVRADDPALIHLLATGSLGLDEELLLLLSEGTA